MIAWSILFVQACNKQCPHSKIAFTKTIIMQRVTIYILACGLFCNTVGAQELYVFSEPASNMPAKSIAAKFSARFPDSKLNNYFKQRYMPELMFGVNKNLMVHVSGTFSDFYTNRVKWESVKTYAKWRFYSKDKVHQHFRLAAFIEGAVTNNPFLYDELNLDGDNDGVQGGLIATQLLNKLAISGSVSVLKVFAPRNEHVHGKDHSLEALSYNVSAGYLLFPRDYTNYNQTNVNVYVEALGMKGINGKDYMLDVAPAIQFIFNSNFKINIGARFQTLGNMIRVGENNYFVSIERTFLNALKKRKK
jgi:hypothetical protein